MSSWRDETTQQVQDDLDDLLDVAVRAGQEQLDQAGEFYPFAVALDEAGEAAQVRPEMPPQEVLDVVDVHDRCWQALRAGAEAHRAVAVVTNVGGPDGDAVAVALEHREGPAIEVFLPYRTHGKTGGKKPPQKHTYGDLQAIAGHPRVWG